MPKVILLLWLLAVPLTATAEVLVPPHDVNINILSLHMTFDTKVVPVIEPIRRITVRCNKDMFCVTTYTDNRK